MVILLYAEKTTVVEQHCRAAGCSCKHYCCVASVQLSSSLPFRGLVANTVHVLAQPVRMMSMVNA